MSFGEDFVRFGMRMSKESQRCNEGRRSETRNKNSKISGMKPHVRET